MPTESPLTNERLDALRARIDSPDTSTADLREITRQLLADNTYWYTEADYWRESYRLVKNLSHDEIGAIIAVRDASKSHPRPCRFPHETCLCDD